MANRAFSCMFHPHIHGKTKLFSYRGPITYQVLAEFGEEIRGYFANDNILSYKIFSIFIELSQNLICYSQEFNCWQDNDRVGTLLITEATDYYDVLTGNLIENAMTENLVSRCQKIADLDYMGWRYYKRELRNQPIVDSSDTRRAGIGLIQASILAKNSISWELERIDDNFSFLILSAKIAKMQANTLL
jgi:hypothetical protein